MNRAVTPISVLRKRAEFLAVAENGKKWVAPGLILQQGGAQKTGAKSLRYGLTASGKIGNAVTRNRARRRLRALAQALLPRHAAQGFDYVLIARATTPSRAFADLERDFITALKKLGAYRERG